MKTRWHWTGLGMLAGVFILSSCTRKVTVEQLLSDEPKVQSSALKRVKKISDDKKVLLVPGLLAALQGNDSQIPDWAMAALKAIGPAGYARVKPALTNADIYTRLCAIEIMASYQGDIRKAVIADLMASIDDPHPLVREEIVFELGKMGPEAASAVSALAKARGDKNEDVSTAADEALKKISTPEARKALETPLNHHQIPKKHKNSK